MGLQQQLTEEIKSAMKSKNTIALEALRAVKSAFLIAKTATSSKDNLTPEQEIKIIQKQVKQRKDSAAIFTEQGRSDLAKQELEQIAILEKFLPEALSEDAIEKIILDVIEKTGASGMRDMGKVMRLVSMELAGRADGKTISGIVKKNLIQN